MKKTQLIPRSQQELDRWINLLLDAKADYKVETIGKQQFLLVSVDDAVNILEVEPPKPMSKGMKVTLIVLAVLLVLMIIGISMGNSMQSAEESAAFVDHRNVMGKTKAELVSAFGAPTNEYEFKEDCPTGGCSALDFKNGLAVTLRDGKAYRFDFTTAKANANNLLSKIGLDNDQEPDVQNETATRWTLVDGLDVTVLTANDEFTYSVTQLNEKGIQAAERQRKIEAIFDAWSGEVPALRESIKKTMNDPSSYDHVETRYDDSGDGNTFPVECTFRGKNAFGGVVLNKVRATIDLEGNVVEANFIN